MSRANKEPVFETTLPNVEAGNKRSKWPILLASATLALTLTSCSAGTSASEGSSPEATSSISAVDPSEKPLSVASLELPASLTPEQISTTIIQERYTQWQNAGFTDANYQAWLRNDENVTPEGEFIRNTITNEIGDNFADAMLVPNWRDIPELTQFVESRKNNNTATLEFLFKTKLDDTPFETGFKVDSPVTVTSQTADTMTLSTIGSQYDNAAESRAHELDPNRGLVNGHTFNDITQLVLIDGIWKIESTNSTMY